MQILSKNCGKKHEFCRSIAKKRETTCHMIGSGGKRMVTNKMKASRCFRFQFSKIKLIIKTTTIFFSKASDLLELSHKLTTSNIFRRYTEKKIFEVTELFLGN